MTKQGVNYDSTSPAADTISWPIFHQAIRLALLLWP